LVLRETLDAVAVAFLARLFLPRATFFAVFFAGAPARLPPDFVVDFLRAVFLAAINVHVTPKSRHKIGALLLAGSPDSPASKPCLITDFHFEAALGAEFPASKGLGERRRLQFIERPCGDPGCIRRFR
jgi:hypothetical protein